MTTAPSSSSAPRGRRDGPWRRRCSPAGWPCGPRCDPGREGAAPAGTAPVAVDLVSGRGLAAALDGARAAYHLAPNVHPDEVGIARRVADAAAAAGLPRVVFHSVLHPEDARMPHHRRKCEAESLLRAVLGERLTVLRPAAYHQNLLGQALDGAITVPYSPDAPFTTVDLGDVAQVAADALTGAHAGATLDLAGPEVLTTRQMAEQAASVLGRPVEVRRTSTDAWAARAGRRPARGRARRPPRDVPRLRRERPRRRRVRAGHGARTASHDLARVRVPFRLNRSR